MKKLPTLSHARTRRTIMNLFDPMSAAIQNAQKNIQALFVTPRSGHLYRLVCANSGKVLDVDGGSVQDGAAVQQWTVTGRANQHWSFEAVGAVNGQPAYKLVCANSG